MSRTSFVAAVLQTAETARIAVPTMLEGMLRGGTDRHRVDRRIERWAQKGARLSEMRVETLGLEHIDERETYVVMSNHQSNWDIIALYYAFPHTLRMVAKMEMRRIPLMGTAMEHAEFVFVDRTDKRQAFKAIRLAEQRIRSGVNVWIAPEGTRSRDGRLGPFKKGGFIMALDTRTRILPCTLEGTRRVVPPGAATIRKRVPVRVQFHPPVDPQEWGHERRDELVAHVRDIIASALPRELRESDAIR
ncbi:MAG: lysophospholipid acyltransferase family protein [Myxococcota bacterium]